MRVLLADEHETLLSLTQKGAIVSAKVSFQSEVALLVSRRSPIHRWFRQVENQHCEEHG
jgi:hypothetical protein